MNLLVASFVMPSNLPLLNVLFFNGLLGRDAGAAHLTGATNDTLGSIVIVLLNLAMNYSARTDRFLALSAVGVFFLNTLTFVVTAASNMLFIGFFGLFLPRRGGVGPLVNGTNISTMPVTTHVSRGLNLRCSSGGCLLVRTVNPGITKMVNSTMTTNILLKFLDWACVWWNVGAKNITKYAIAPFILCCTGHLHIVYV